MVKLNPTKLTVDGVVVTPGCPEEGAPGLLAAGRSRILPWTR